MASKKESAISLMDATLDDESAIWQVQEIASSPSSTTSQDQSQGDDRCARRRLIKYKRYPKPPYAYLAMIIVAIHYSPNGHMTLAEVIKALENMFSFFRCSYKGWKDSVRHNISNSPCIVKVEPEPGAGAFKAARWRVCWEMVPRDVFLLQRGRPGCKDKHWKPTLLQHLGLQDIILPSKPQDSSPSKEISNHSSALGIQACLPQEPARKSKTSSYAARYEDLHGIPTFSSFMVQRQRNLREEMTSSLADKQVNNHHNLQIWSVQNIHDSTTHLPMPHQAFYQSQIVTSTDFAEDRRTSPLYLNNFLFDGRRSPGLDLPPIDVPSCDYGTPIYPSQRGDYPHSYSILSLNCGTRLFYGQVNHRQNPRANSASTDCGTCTYGSDIETNDSPVQNVHVNHRICTSVGCQTSVRTDLYNYVGMQGSSEACGRQQPSATYPRSGSLALQNQFSQLPGEERQWSSHCSIPNNNINQNCLIDSRYVSAKCQDPSNGFPTHFVTGDQSKYSGQHFDWPVDISRFSY